MSNGANELKVTVSEEKVENKSNEVVEDINNIENGGNVESNTNIDDNINLISQTEGITENTKFLNSEYYDEFGRPKYDEIINYQNQLIAEVELNTPLISDKLDIEYLNIEFKDSEFVNSIKDIEEKYKQIRTVRRDGNCFYRSFMFRLFEELASTKSPTLYNPILKLIQEGKELCLKHGYSWLILEDFYDAFISEWKFVWELTKTEAENYMYFTYMTIASYYFKTRRDALI